MSFRTPRSESLSATSGVSAKNAAGRTATSTCRVPFVTEKAYPENEAVVTTTIARGSERPVSTAFLYEHRVGRRGQYEIFSRDLDEVGGAYKHVLFDSHRSGSILSGGGEIKVSEGRRGL